MNGKNAFESRGGLQPSSFGITATTIGTLLFVQPASADPEKWSATRLIEPKACIFTLEEKEAFPAVLLAAVLPSLIKGGLDLAGNALKNASEDETITHSAIVSLKSRSTVSGGRSFNKFPTCLHFMRGSFYDRDPSKIANWHKGDENKNYKTWNSFRSDFDTLRHENKQQDGDCFVSYKSPEDGEDTATRCRNFESQATQWANDENGRDKNRQLAKEFLNGRASEDEVFDGTGISNLQADNREFLKLSNFFIDYKFSWNTIRDLDGVFLADMPSVFLEIAVESTAEGRAFRILPTFFIYDDSAAGSGENEIVAQMVLHDPGTTVADGEGVSGMLHLGGFVEGAGPWMLRDNGITSPWFVSFVKGTGQSKKKPTGAASADGSSPSSSSSGADILPYNVTFRFIETKRGSKFMKFLSGVFEGSKEELQSALETQLIKEKKKDAELDALTKRTEAENEYWTAFAEAETAKEEYCSVTGDEAVARTASLKLRLAQAKANLAAAKAELSPRYNNLHPVTSTSGIGCP